MFQSFFILLRFFAFWLIFFFIDRIIFLAYFHEKLKKVSFSEIAQTALYGVRLDASMAAYLSVIPLLFFIALWFFPKLSISKSFIKGFVLFFITIFSIISISNFNIYREWGSKINYKALDFAFNSTSEAIASGSSSPIVSSLAIFAGLLILSIYISRKLIIYNSPDATIPFWKKVAASSVFIAITILFIRGGLGTSPINQSMAYFSEKPILNHSAVNTEWNLIHDVLNNRYVNSNPFKYYSKQEAKNIVDSLYKIPEGAPPRILKVHNPNIVLIILESYTADVIERLGGEKGIAPNFEKLIDKGLFFNQIYASGDRTDKGLVAILSAFPAQAIQSIIKTNDKQEKLPAIPQVLSGTGYSTSFYYGGQSEFFNIKSYILSHGFHKLIDKNNFDQSDLSSWGAYDHKVFEKNAADLDFQKQPFFSTIMTLSNHEPFQLPGKPHYPGKSSADKFRSTSYYTDSSLGSYLESVKNKDWYKNTLFIIIADHGHRLPKDVYEIYNPGRFRIPLLLFGEVLKDEFSGQTIDKVGNQTDVAATLLSQLDLPVDKFRWSHDLLNPKTPEFSFFCWDNGFGFATKNQVISVDNVSKNIIFKKYPGNLKETNSSQKSGKAYMQQVFQDYIDY
ncbi:LTA synthase family protein [Daejeonella oryzae]|uniref:LTA synthase family protein n=1 Tax=Daejeonella oryzae TaxID=1122943 RepID=UPI00040B611F|nr:LTA synthase family protein [Daejeonella oryzae]